MKLLRRRRSPARAKSRRVANMKQDLVIGNPDDGKQLFTSETNPSANVQISTARDVYIFNTNSCVEKSRCSMSKKSIRIRAKKLLPFGRCHCKVPVQEQGYIEEDITQMRRQYTTPTVFSRLVPSEVCEFSEIVEELNKDVKTQTPKLDENVSELKRKINKFKVKIRKHFSRFSCTDSVQTEGLDSFDSSPYCSSEGIFPCTVSITAGNKCVNENNSKQVTRKQIPDVTEPKKLQFIRIVGSVKVTQTETTQTTVKTESNKFNEKDQKEELCSTWRTEAKNAFACLQSGNSFDRHIKCNEATEETCRMCKTFKQDYVPTKTAFVQTDDMKHTLTNPVESNSLDQSINDLSAVTNEERNANHDLSENNNRSFIPGNQESKDIHLLKNEDYNIHCETRKCQNKLGVDLRKNDKENHLLLYTINSLLASDTEGETEIKTLLPVNSDTEISEGMLHMKLLEPSLIEETIAKRISQEVQSPTKAKDNNYSNSTVPTEYPISSFFSQLTQDLDSTDKSKVASCPSSNERFGQEDKTELSEPELNPRSPMSGDGFKKNSCEKLYSKTACYENVKQPAGIAKKGDIEGNFGEVSNEYCVGKKDGHAKHVDMVDCSNKGDRYLTISDDKSFDEIKKLYVAESEKDLFLILLGKEQICKRSRNYCKQKPSLQLHAIFVTRMSASGLASLYVVKLCTFNILDIETHWLLNIVNLKKKQISVIENSRKKWFVTVLQSNVCDSSSPHSSALYVSDSTMNCYQDFPKQNENIQSDYQVSNFSHQLRTSRTDRGKDNLVHACLLKNIVAHFFCFSFSGRYLLVSTVEQSRRRSETFLKLHDDEVDNNKHNDKHTVDDDLDEDYNVCFPISNTIPIKENNPVCENKDCLRFSGSVIPAKENDMYADIVKNKKGDERRWERRNGKEDKDERKEDEQYERKKNSVRFLKSVPKKKDEALYIHSSSQTSTDVKIETSEISQNDIFIIDSGLGSPLSPAQGTPRCIELGKTFPLYRHHLDDCKEAIYPNQAQKYESTKCTPEKSSAVVTPFYRWFCDSRSENQHIGSLKWYDPNEIYFYTSSQGRTSSVKDMCASCPGSPYGEGLSFCSVLEDFFWKVEEKGVDDHIQLKKHQVSVRNCLGMGVKSAVSKLESFHSMTCFNDYYTKNCSQVLSKQENKILSNVKNKAQMCYIIGNVSTVETQEAQKSLTIGKKVSVVIPLGLYQNKKMGMSFDLGIQNEVTVYSERLLCEEDCRLSDCLRNKCLPQMKVDPGVDDDGDDSDDDSSVGKKTRKKKMLKRRKKINNVRRQVPKPQLELHQKKASVSSSKSASKNKDRAIDSLSEIDQALHLSSEIDRAIHSSTEKDRAIHSSSEIDRAIHSSSEIERAIHSPREGNRDWKNERSEISQDELFIFDSGLGSSLSTAQRSSMYIVFGKTCPFYLLPESSSTSDKRKYGNNMHKKFSYKLENERKNPLKSRIQIIKKTSIKRTVRKYFKKYSIYNSRFAKSVVRELYIQPVYLSVFGLGSYFDRFNNGPPPTPEERLQYEWLRLATFSNYTGNGNAIALARNGFYHDHSEGPSSTRCFMCEARNSDWERFDNVEDEHMRQSPNCPFHASRGQESVNIPISYENNDDAALEPRETTTVTSTSTTVTEVSTTSTDAVNEATRALQSTQISDASMSGGESISQQPTEDPESRDRSLLAFSQPRQLRALGRTGNSYSTIIAPRRNNVAIGARSNVGIDPSRNGSSTSGTASQSPGRPSSVLGGPVGAGAFAGPSNGQQVPVSTTTESSQQSNVPSPAVEAAAGAGSGAGGRTDPTITVVVDNPKHPDYLNIETRVNSYHGWPDYLDQTARQMSEAGFFYVGVADFTRCFCCGGGLRNWEPGDDPMLEHTRWFPRCEYVNKLKGERYVAAVQRRHTEHMAEQQRQQLELAQRRDENRNPPDPMTTDAAAVMREMGYSIERTREAILAVRQQTGTVDVTTQQVLTWLLDYEERRLNSETSNTELGVRPPPSPSPTETSTVETSTPSTVVNTGTSSESSTVNTTTSSVSAGTTTSTVSSTSTMATAEVQQSGTTASSSTEGSESGTGNQQTGSAAGASNSSSSTSQSGTSEDKQPGASGGDSDEPKSTTEGTASSETSTKSSKKKNTKKKSKNKASTKPGTSGATGSDIDAKSLKAENEKLREMQTCKICMERAVNTTLLPCGHLVCCDTCAARLQRCPICRKRIKGTVKTFMS